MNWHLIIKIWIEYNKNLKLVELQTKISVEIKILINTVNKKNLKNEQAFGRNLMDFLQFIGFEP